MASMTNFLWFVGRRILAMLCITNSFVLNQACLRLHKADMMQRRKNCITLPGRKMQNVHQARRKGPKSTCVPHCLGVLRGQVSAGTSAPQFPPTNQRWLAGIFSAFFHHLLLKEQVEWVSKWARRRESNLFPSADAENKYEKISSASRTLC